MLKITFVLPIFNGLEYTKNCLKSIYNDLGIEVINADISTVIVDDGSTDKSAEWININYPQVHLLSGNGNLWWSGGINKAVKYAIDNIKTDYIIWWNNDIIADKMYLINLLQILNKVDDRVIIGSKIYYEHQKSIIWSMGGLFNPYTGSKCMIGSNESDNGEYQEIMEVDWLPGMGTVTHKSVYDVIGMVDEINFPQYHGDSDFTFKAKLYGYRILVYPSLKIYNDVSHSGLRHEDSFKRLMESLFSIKSNYNLNKDILYYKRYSKSYKAYFVLINKYFKYVAGFIKWRFLGIFGIKK